MSVPALGRLEKADLRQVWGNEASDFTPWLADEGNLRLLGETLGLELEVVTREKGVGRFWADLLCKDTVTNDYVLIENQLGRSDHSHLGQILTYCAGLSGAAEEIRTAVWIASTFTEEHRATLDWFNEISGDRFRFFGLEIDLWRIADSPLAPKFNVVCRPNDWSRDVGVAVTHADLSEHQRRNLQYWTAFAEYLTSSSKVLRPKKPSPDSWMAFALGTSVAHLSAVISDFDLETQSFDQGQQVRAMVSLTGPSADALYLALQEQRQQLEADMGEPLRWYRPPDYHVRRIFLVRRANLDDAAEWPAQHAWFREKLERMHRVFASRIPALRESVAVVSPVGDAASTTTQP
jgi:hypothetical protein